MKNTELAPGINVYSIGRIKAEKYLNTFKIYGDPLYLPGHVVAKNEEGFYNKLDVSHRKCEVFSANAVSNCHQDDPLRAMCLGVENDVVDFVNHFCAKYTTSQVAKNHDFIFLKYEKGDFFTAHNDDCPAHPRTVSSTIYFNEDYEGGQIFFKYFDIEYKPKQGDCIVFSSAFPYMHGVKEITSGKRYAAVNWYRYIGVKNEV